VNGWLVFFRRAPQAAHAEGSDARPIASRTLGRALDAELERRGRIKRRALVVGLIVAGVAGSLPALIGDGGYFDMLRLRAEIRALEADIAERGAAVALLETEVRGLKNDPLARERVAREELGLSRPGEINVLLPREDVPDWEHPAVEKVPPQRP